MISNYLHYQFALLLLLAKRDIDMATWRYAAWNRPIAVCGRTGSWVVDAPPEALNTTISQRALVQFLIGMLMVAGAVGWLANTVEGIGFAATLSLVSLKAVLVIVLGVVLALDATALGIYRWVFMSCPSRAVCQKRLASFMKDGLWGDDQYLRDGHHADRLHRNLAAGHLALAGKAPAGAVPALPRRVDHAAGTAAYLHHQGNAGVCER